VVAAAEWAKTHSDIPVTVTSYADPYGGPTPALLACARRWWWPDWCRNRVLATRIQRNEIGSVKFQIDPQESRRVEIAVGRCSELHV
jgi:hypothetical protein